MKTKNSKISIPVVKISFESFKELEDHFGPKVMYLDIKNDENISYRGLLIPCNGAEEFLVTTLTSKDLESLKIGQHQIENKK